MAAFITLNISFPVILIIFAPMAHDIGAYYDQTQNHYQRWWQLQQGMALHYGLWDEHTTSFVEALHNMNQHLANLATIKPGEKVLDAGCGVGGAAIFLAKEYGARVQGITLSQLQVATASENALRHQVNHLAGFSLQDYAATKFADCSFDLIWACESSSSAPDKAAMAGEWFRLLKPGGRLVLTDFFSTANLSNKDQQLLDNWSAIWAMSPLITTTELTGYLEKAGFAIRQVNDLTRGIGKTARRMYLSYWLGLVPAVLYNTLFSARPYARNHYKSGLYQYRALKRKCWSYHSLLAIKPD